MRALIAMSGGVDSSVAAKLTIDMGYECVGCTMKLCGDFDPTDAENVARRLNMPFFLFDRQKEFKENVISWFTEEYFCGRTPNPCVECNSKMKFGMLLNEAKRLGCDMIVTGHYAVIERRGGKFLLQKAADSSKDQSYFLYKLTQKQLSHTLFPLGGMTKTEVRQIAEENGFVNADKPDSQDICFVPDGDYARVIELCSGKRSEPGCFTDTNGNILGEHKGIIHYTVGQRKGLGLSFAEPHYVVDICPRTNTVVLGTDSELFSDTLTTQLFNWISGTAPVSPIRCLAKIRYRHREQPATAYPLENGGVKIVFDEPQRAITPGQAAVIYDINDGKTVLGGGTIMKEVR